MFSHMACYSCNKLSTIFGKCSPALPATLVKLCNRNGGLPEATDCIERVRGKNFFPYKPLIYSGLILPRRLDAVVVVSEIAIDPHKLPISSFLLPTVKCRL
jgi:hypothetical protein